MPELGEMIDAVKRERGFSDEAWEMYSASEGQVQALDAEVSKLRDIARRAAVLTRWFSSEDFPFVEMTEQEQAAINDDAQTLAAALERHGYYPEGWGN
jgi:hypothetical protein